MKRPIKFWFKLEDAPCPGKNHHERTSTNRQDQMKIEDESACSNGSSLSSTSESYSNQDETSG